MTITKRSLTLGLIVFVGSLSLTGYAQESAATENSSAAVVNGVVPSLMNYSGVLKDVNGKPLTEITGVTFLLYKDEQGGAPVWIETQNVVPDKNGRYTATLGTTKPNGSLAQSFANGEAHWLGVQISGQEEQSRVLLVAVPYALKAGDAETIGGLPPSAFMLANGTKANSTSAGGSQTSAPASKNSAPPVNPAVTGKGAVDYIPMWDTTSDIVDSVIFQKTNLVGIGTTAPAATLDVNGKGDVRDTLTLFPKSTDNTLAVNGTAFKVSSTGLVTFVTGQTFPGAGTITGITTASGSGLSGGGTTGTLSLKVPALGITNAMLQNSKITLNANTAGGVTTPGAMSLGSTYTIGLKPCASGQILQYSGTVWNCAAAVGTGTISGVTAGAGLSGGGTTGVVTLNVKTAGVTNTMLQHPAVTIAAGTDLTGGGPVALGATTTLNLDTTKVPALASANAFTSSETFTGSVSVPEISVTNKGSGDGIDVLSTSGNGVYSETNGFDGGDFISFGTGYGSFAESTGDANFTTAAAGWQFGSSKEDIGVWGYAGSSVGIGNYAESFAASTEGTKCCAGAYSIGLWADTSGSSSTAAGIGALATVDTGYGVVTYSNSTDSTIWAENDVSGDSSAPVLVATGSAGYCITTVSGNLTCTGTLTGAASVNGGAKKVALTAYRPRRTGLKTRAAANSPMGRQWFPSSPPLQRLSTPAWSTTYSSLRTATARVCMSARSQPHRSRCMNSAGEPPTSRLTIALWRNVVVTKQRAWRT